MTTRCVRCALGVLAILLAPAATLEAQQPGDSLGVEIARLRALVDSLRGEVARIAPAGAAPLPEDPIAQLRVAAAAAAASGGAPPAATEPPDFAGRERSLQALNPEISVNADVFGFVNPDDANADNFTPREFEIAMQSALDPFSRAKIFLSRHAVGPEVVPFAEAEAEEEDEHGGFEIEEGYVEWVGLPAGVRLKVGKFQQRFGTLNRWHSHALPVQSRSLPHLAYLGEEALSQAGVSVSWLAPIGGGGAGTYEAALEVTRSSAELFGESTRPSVLGHVNGFWQFGAATDFELNFSWINGSYESETEFFDRDVYGVELAFNRIPPELTRQRGLTVRAGAMMLEGLLPEEDDPAGVVDVDGRALGLWSLAEVRLSPSWLVGARLDWAENPHDPSRDQTLLSPTLTWWQSEFVRVRAEYDVLSSFEGSGTLGLFALQLTFAMGPHKHESY
jgi:hypothetical protein